MRAVEQYGAVSYGHTLLPQLRQRPNTGGSEARADPELINLGRARPSGSTSPHPLARQWRKRLAPTLRQQLRITQALGETGLAFLCTDRTDPNGYWTGERTAPNLIHTDHHRGLAQQGTLYFKRWFDWHYGRREGTAANTPE